MLQELSPTEPDVLPHPSATRVEIWPINKPIPYARNPRKNDAAVSQMVASIREFGFKIPCLVRGMAKWSTATFD